MTALQGEKGTTLLELTIGLGISAVLLSVLASIVSVLLWLPGERRDRVTVAQDLQFAEHWITRDANSADRFSAATSPVYGSFRWNDYTGAVTVNNVVTYSYDAANGYLMRTEQQNGAIVSTLAVAKNIASEDDVRFVWTPGMYSVLASLTSTVSTGTTKEGITTTVRSTKVTMAARPRSEPLSSPPGSVSLPPPPAGSEFYSVDGNPTLATGSYVSGGATELQAADNTYYEVDSSIGQSKAVVFAARSNSLTTPATISQIEVRLTGKSSRQGIIVNFFAKNSPDGFPATAESGLTFTTMNEPRTEYFYLSPEALSYVNSLPDRRVDIKIDSSGDASYTLFTDQILFVAIP